ncbi:MAG TPA: ABC transporter permease [Bacteroidia bacterium]|nr:ABC transporter permease [Bacteroidia bacterium]
MTFRRKKYVDIDSYSLAHHAWKRFKKNRLAMFSLYFIILTVIIALLGFLITPDSTPNSNNQVLELSVKPPGFKVQMLLVRENQDIKEVNFISKMLYGQPSFYHYIPIYNYGFQGPFIVAEGYTGMVPNNGPVVKYNMADVIYPLDYNKHLVNDSVKLSTIAYVFGSSTPISRTYKDMSEEIKAKNIVTKTYLLGTDQEGRDLLSRLMIGTRISLAVGFISVLIAFSIGIFLGATAGFYRGKWDEFVMWLINVVWSLPTLLLVIAITLALGKGFWQVFIAVGLTMWVDVARIVRGQVMSIREENFIEAGNAMGFSNFRVIFKHILPNIMGAIIVVAADNFASAILIEAGLSFLGIGAQPPIASWGAMINTNRGYIITDSAYLAFLPGICIMFMVLAFFLLGNGLRDALDSKTSANQLVGA